MPGTRFASCGGAVGKRALERDDDGNLMPLGDDEIAGLQALLRQHNDALATAMKAELDS
jgi:hypothetical protein